jgi:predicted metal-binding membrane protein
MLVRYRQALGRVGDARKGWLTALAGMAYFSVWGGVGVIAFPLGVALAAITMESATLARIVPMAIGLVVVIAGVLQFSAWKARQLVCCRGGAGGLGALGDDVSTALSYGLRLGFHCTSCCAGLTVILLVIGVMDLRAMAIVTAAITLERLAPGGRRVARIIGAVIVGAGVVLMGQAA